MKKALVSLKNGKMMVTSLELVEEINLFRGQEGKPDLRHDTLLNIIRDEFEEEIAAQEILEGSYKDKQNQKRPMFELTSLQAKQLLARESKRVRKALLIYIETLEAALRERNTTEWLETRIKGKVIRRGITDAIQFLIPYAEEQGSKNMRTTAYRNYTSLVHKIVGIEDGKRSEATFKQLMHIGLLEDMITNTILEEMEKGVYYKEIYKICKARAEQCAKLAYIGVYGGNALALAG